MSYNETHTEDDCDKCLKRVGKDNLLPVPFLYLDRNDKVHKDATSNIKTKDYKQYYVCKECLLKGV